MGAAQSAMATAQNIRVYVCIVVVLLHSRWTDP
jgi:hypothetical protein